MPQTHKKHRRHGFQSYALVQPAQPSYPALQYLRAKSSFWIAALSLVAFVGGNMLGQHGWHAFWKAVLGAYDDSMIVYDGIIAPIEYVPGPNWTGDSKLNTFRQVPEKDLVTLPRYSLTDSEENTQQVLFAKRVYSVAFAGDYKTGKRMSGSHNGVDISTPDGNAVRAPANGRIVRVGDDPSGFGLLIVMKLPNVPDPKNTSKVTDLYCTFAHLSAQLVMEGDIVQKGKVIALTGHTGFASGPHLHFQCDDATSNGSPIWAFTSAELLEAKLTFSEGINTAFHQERLLEHSIDPMAYVEAQYPPVTIVKNAGPAVAVAGTSDTNATRTLPARERAKVSREERVQRRLSQRRLKQGMIVAVRESAPLVSIAPFVPSPQPPADPVPAPDPAPASNAQVPSSMAAGVHLNVPESFKGRSWQTMTVTLVDANGNRAAGASFDRQIVMRPAYGGADIRPSSLTSDMFTDGSATVQFLARGTRTVVIESAGPFSALSGPVKYEP